MKKTENLKKNEFQDIFWKLVHKLRLAFRANNGSEKISEPAVNCGIDNILIGIKLWACWRTTLKRIDIAFTLHWIVFMGRTNKAQI